MRPTNLGFRSPKERTAEYNFPSVTFDGRYLAFKQQSLQSSLPKSKRFRQYDEAARRTGTSLGPGSYNLSNVPSKQWGISGTPVIRPYVAMKEPVDNGYYFIGNSMVHDANFVKRNKPIAQHVLESKEFKPARLSTTVRPRDYTAQTENSLNKLSSSPYHFK